MKSTKNKVLSWIWTSTRTLIEKFSSFRTCVVLRFAKTALSRDLPTWKHFKLNFLNLMTFTWGKRCAFVGKFIWSLVWKAMQSDEFKLQFENFVIEARLILWNYLSLWLKIAQMRTIFVNNILITNLIAH